MNNIIFLDIDGVLNTKHSIYNRIYLDSNLVKNLSFVATKTDSKIVISSAWRIVRNLELIKMSFHFVGFNQIERIIDKTGNSGKIRGDQIEAWIKENKFVGKYIIIDDSNDFYDYQLDRLVNTNFNNGFTIEKAFEAIKLMGDFIQ